MCALGELWQPFQQHTFQNLWSSVPLLKGCEKFSKDQHTLTELYIFLCQVTFTHPHPSSQLTGLLGLCSQSLRCDCSWSSRSVAVQPKPALSQLIWSLDSMLRMMRGTGRRWANVTTVRSTGQICCWANHCVIQALQNACSQCGAWNENEHSRKNKGIEACLYNHS